MNIYLPVAEPLYKKLTASVKTEIARGCGLFDIKSGICLCADGPDREFIKSQNKAGWLSDRMIYSPFFICSDFFHLGYSFILDVKSIKRSKNRIRNQEKKVWNEGQWLEKVNCIENKLSLRLLRKRELFQDKNGGYTMKISGYEKQYIKVFSDIYYSGYTDGTN